ncbi:hypothetical protein AMS68_000822 [Peltaster fructicola]|uniref:Uncharacterized protein n=1 Tax=Peltaster fructicola TaxID=286661 RepID=A0A6H0XL05_9PEZI|nr:hypothetical protein AMS68_000822 [Peltaster fructicola]
MSSSRAVNVPVDPKAKERDVNAKLQLYGIYSAFANGKVPSNAQIDVAMNSALAWNGMKNPPKALSQEGKHLVRDLQDVIEKAKVLFLTKNDGNLLQDFIWQTQYIGAGNASTPNAPLDKETAKQHGNEALEGFRTLGTLLITNGQFRKLLNDAAILFRDIAGDAASNAAKKINPSEDQLQQIDRPAADNTWHEKPDLSTQGIKSQLNDTIPIAKKEAKEVAGDASQAADPHGSRDPESAANRNADNLDGRAGVNAAAQSAKEKIQDRVPDEQQDRVKETAKEYRARTNDYFKKKLPKDRREQIIYRLKKMVVEIQGHEDYSRAIDTLLRLGEEYTGHAKNVAGQSVDAVQGGREQTSVQRAEADLKTLLERFANSTSFDDLFDSINQIYQDADRDPELKNWFTDIDRYIRRCLKEQGYILKDSSDEEWNRLYDHGNFLLRERYRNHTDRIGDELKFLAGQFEQDAQNKAFADSMNKLFTDLGNDENGKPTFKPHLVTDLTDVILPALFENIRYVPIPRIEYSDPMVDFAVENLVIEGDNLAPNSFEFGSDNYWRWGRKSIKNKNKNKVMLAVSGVQLDLRDVAYYVKKKEGFPSITDKGLLDIFLGGSGLSFKVAMETADPKDQHNFFKINTVDVDIKNMQIKVKQSNHKLLFNLFKPLALRVLRPVIQKVVELQIRNNVSKLDQFLYEAKKRADAELEDFQQNPDPERLPNFYQRYYNAIQARLAEGKKKADEATKDKTVNVAITKQDSIFKNISLPGGISTKATEYKELAAKGDKWESPVFGIGSAPASSSLPRATEPKRKPHNATTATLNPKGATSGGYSSGAQNSTGYSSGGYGSATSASNYGTQGGQSTGSYGTSASQSTGAYGSTGATYAGLPATSLQSTAPGSSLSGQNVGTDTTGFSSTAPGTGQYSSTAPISGTQAVTGVQPTTNHFQQ